MLDKGASHIIETYHSDLELWYIVSDFCINGPQNIFVVLALTILRRFEVHVCLKLLFYNIRQTIL